MDYTGLVGGPVIPFAEDVEAADLPRLHELMDLLLTEEARQRGDSAAAGGGAG